MAMRETKQSRTHRFLSRGGRILPVVSAGVLVLIFASCAALVKKEVVPAEAAVVPIDPNMGDWEGSYVTDTGESGPVVAQVIALGNGQYRANLMPEFDRRYSSVPFLEGQRSGTAVRFSGEIDPSNWGGSGIVAIQGQIEGETFAGAFASPDRVGTVEMKKVVRLSPSLDKEPPAGAVVLFDGKNFDQWVHAKKNEGPPVQWKLLKGAMEVVPKSDDIVTERKFSDFELHVEFRTPFMPAARGQKRGNSGVYLQGRYEVQVLASYGLEGMDNECGGIYQVAAPRVNMCAPPLQWQTYDITFHAPRFDEDGNKTENARITVVHNGVAIHEDLEIPGPTGGALNESEAEPDGLMLQEHGNRVQYRNIWLVELP